MTKVIDIMDREPGDERRHRGRSGSSRRPFTPEVAGSRPVGATIINLQERRKLMIAREILRTSKSLASI